MFDTIKEVLLTPAAIIIAAAVFALFGYAVRAIPKIVEWKHWTKVLPLACMVIGCVAAVIPGVVDGEGISIGYKILFGIWAGFLGLVAIGARKLINKFISKFIKKEIEEKLEDSQEDEPIL